MQPIREIGDFRAEIYSYSPKESTTSDSVAFHVDCLLTHRMNVATNQWEEMPGAWTAEGDFWYIQKNGEENIQTVEMLMQVLGWDGTPQQLAGVDENFVVLPEDKRWKPNPVIVTIKEEEYKGQKQHKVRCIRRADMNRVQIPESAARRLAEKMSKSRGKPGTVSEDGTFTDPQTGVTF